MSVKHTAKAPHEALKTLGKLLASMRMRRRWRQTDIAERLQTSRQTIARMERGDPSVAAGLYFSAAWLLDVPALAGMDPTNMKSNDALNNLLTLLATSLPQRASTTKEKPTDDNF